MSIEARQNIQGLIFIGPWLTGLILFWAYPFLYSLLISFYKITIKGDKLNWSFIGIQNFRTAIFNDPVFIEQLLIFAQESIIMIPIIVLFALIVSVLLNQRMKARSFFRAVFFLPVIFTTGQVVLSLLGQGSGTLEALQDENIRTFITDNLSPNWAITITNILNRFVLILWYSGVQVLIYLGGMQSISANVYEAAKIDRANGWETFWKITLPSLIPFTILNIIYTIVDIYTLPFNPILSSTKAHMIKTDTGMGYASAITWIYFLIAMLNIALVFIIFRKSFAVENKKRR